MYAIAIHGGAGAMRPTRGDADHEQRARDGLRAALDAGAAILAREGAALDSVEASVRLLEDDPCFNAGRGSVLTSEGCVELDAAIMDGTSRRAGAVAGLKTTRAPISLARRLMEQGPHVFLSGVGADQFAGGEAPPVVLAPPAPPLPPALSAGHGPPKQTVLMSELQASATAPRPSATRPRARPRRAKAGNRMAGIRRPGGPRCPRHRRPAGLRPVQCRAAWHPPP